MRNFIAALMLVVSFSVNAGKEQYSVERWLSYGSYGAIVLASKDNKEDSKFYGLVLECSPSKGKYRISVKDIYAEPGDVVRWETDKKMGSISNKASMVVRTLENEVELNKRLVSAIKHGSWIEFYNTRTDSSAKYTLKGSSKAISSIVSCK
jgi:hypothetical protein